MSSLSEDEIQLGNEAIVFAYGHNVNLYKDVFNIKETASTSEIYLSYIGVLKELEVANDAFRHLDCKLNETRQFALRLGMQPSHLVGGMHPRDYLGIKIDAVKRAYNILADKPSRREYDSFLNDHLEHSQTGHEDNTYCDESMTCSSSVTSDDDDMDTFSNDDSDSLCEPSSVEWQPDPDFPFSPSYHSDDVFDPFNLYDELRKQSITSNDELDQYRAVPITPDTKRYSNDSFKDYLNVHPVGHETSVFICSLPTSDDEGNENDEDDDDESINLSGVRGSMIQDGVRDAEIQPEMTEEDGQVSFRSLENGLSEDVLLDRMNLVLSNVECVSEEEEDEYTDSANGDMTPKGEWKINKHAKQRKVWTCVDSCLDELDGTVDDTVVVIKDLFGGDRIENDVYW